ncbi:MAG TPA: oligopeptide/dipeptide ABC transporter ATP-binding protein [Rhabdochlamydiaceae bacterium]|nr:oligopeptide/dipeptide ABC transporter ATP-binding protein [Rhabdochlamydiaceae bacterium]
MIIVKNLKKYFSTSKGLLRAVDDVSFEILEGQTLGLVGESGCGKSTLGRVLLRLLEPTSGEVQFDGNNIFALPPSELKKWRQEAQMIFQDPYASLNPRMTAQDIITEPLKIHNIDPDPDTIAKSFQQVSLNPHHRCRYPHEFSGGQRQRIGIARALILNPRFLVCDEPIAALDVSVQAQIVNLLKDLQKQMGLTYLFISHDLRMVRYIADHVAVMYLGKIVEKAPTELLFQRPLHPYTQALLSAIPFPDPVAEKKRTRIALTGEVPSPIHPPNGGKGCGFCTRCPLAKGVCKETVPELREVEPGHFVSCHLVNRSI